MDDDTGSVEFNIFKDKCTSPLIEHKESGLFVQSTKRDKTYSILIIALCFSNFIWIALFLILTFYNKSKCDTYIYPTDFSVLRSVIQSPKPTTFDDQLRYNTTNHEFWRDLNPLLPQYFGPPSPQIDLAWTKLLAGEILGISEDEIRANVDLNFEEQDRIGAAGQFFTAIDIFHSLHCLNAIRKELDKDYYLSESSFWSAKSQRLHIDHCMNHIRQSLQCHPDLSPITLKRQISATKEVFLLGNAEKHTCYDWDNIMKWINQRKASKLGAWGE